jgi:hypothetical protein
MVTAHAPGSKAAGERAQPGANGCRLTLAALAEAKRLPVEFLAGDRVGLHGLAAGVGIPYFDQTGDLIAEKLRTHLAAKDGSRWPAGKPVAAYGLWRLDEAAAVGFVILVEGESDCWAGWHHELPVLGVPGANAVKVLREEHVEAVGKMYVLREPDAGGETFVAGVARRLRDIGYNGDAFELRMPGGLKDLADLHADEPSEFESRLEQAIRESRPLVLPGDADEGDGPRPQPKVDEPSAGFVWAPLKSDAFARNDYRPTWLVKRQLVKGQPIVIGGPRKVLKTSLVIDLAVSMASGLPFLNEFTVYKPQRVAVLSGESGEFTIQESARRVCQARGLTLERLGENLCWQFTLPQFANAADMKTLRVGLERDKIDVAFLDPTYLSLLSGQRPEASIRAENLFEMGPLFLSIARTCLDAGTTPALIHHTKRDAANKRDPLELDDLAYAGIAEFARQWLLLSRRETYEQGTGLHKLWLSVGGSTGQGGLWSVDVDEGVLDEHFGGRKWEVVVATAGETRKAAGEEKEQAKSQKREKEDKADDTTLLNALDKLDPEKKGAGLNKVQAESRLSERRVLRAVQRLVTDEVIDEVAVEVPIGNKATRKVRGLRRCRSISSHFAEML